MFEWLMMLFTMKTEPVKMIINEEPIVVEKSIDDAPYYIDDYEFNSELVQHVYDIVAQEYEIRTVYGKYYTDGHKIGGKTDYEKKIIYISNPNSLYHELGHAYNDICAFDGKTTDEFTKYDYQVGNRDEQIACMVAAVLNGEYENSEIEAWLGGNQ